jgi:hypothetical protein
MEAEALKKNDGAPVQGGLQEGNPQWSRSLSRKVPVSSQVLAITTVQPTWLTSVRASYVDDPHAQQVLQQLAVDPSSAHHYTLQQGIQRYQGRIWLGNDIHLQSQIVSAFHDSPQGRHSGFPGTYRRLSSLFKWPRLKAMVR